MSFAIKMLLENEAALTNTVLKWRVRLEAQDSGFSFLQHGFEFRTEYQKENSKLQFVFSLAIKVIC